MIHLDQPSPESNPRATVLLTETGSEIGTTPMTEVKSDFSDNLFGFESEEDFIIQAQLFLTSLRQSLNSVEETDSDSTDPRAARWREISAHHDEAVRTQIEALQNWLRTPSDFYQMIQSLYNTIMTLDAAGTSRHLIVQQCLERFQGLLPLGGFLETGMNTAKWGSLFIQSALTFEQPHNNQHPLDSK